MNYLPHISALSGLAMIFPAVFFLLRGVGYSSNDAFAFITISAFQKKYIRKDKYKSKKLFLIGLLLLVAGLTLLLSAFLIDVKDGGAIWGNSRIFF